MADFRIAPFSIYSSSVETGYISEISASFRPHIDLTNMHEDRYGNYSDAPMQGPFTYKYVGGNQQRHIPLNEGTDTPLTRPELFDIYMTGGVLEVRGPDTAGGVDRPRAPYFRDPIAKRPLNIENIQMRTGSTIIGNYSNDYEFIQTVGRTSNNRAFVEANGVGFIGDASLPYSGSLITQFIRPTPADFFWNEYTLKLSGESTVNGGYVNLGKPANLNFLDSETWSISLWVKISSSLSHACTILSKANGGAFSADQYTITVSATGILGGKVGGGNYSDIGGGDRRDDTWHHLVLLCSGPGPFGFYVDGSPVSTAFGSSGEFGNFDILIGATFDDVAGTNPADFFVGEIDEVSFWDTYFDATDVTNLYNGGVPTKLTNYVSSSNLITWLRMGDGTGDGGTTVVDQSTGSNNGTITIAGTGEADIEALLTSETTYVPNLTPLPRPYNNNYAPDRTLPIFDLSGTNNFVFVNRFNAPGGTQVSSRGALDTYAEEFAPNNALPWRNHSVRSVLRSDLARHTPKATEISPDPLQYIEGFEQSTLSASTGNASLMWYGNYSSSLNWYNGAQPPRPAITGTLDAPYAFLRRQGQTTTDDTGPAGAAVGIHYAYAEASDSSNPIANSPQGAGEPNIFYAMSASVSRPSEMSFYYFMYGNAFSTGPNAGFLNVSASLDGITWENIPLVANGVSTYNIVGEQQTAISDPWRKAVVQLGDYAGIPNVWVKIVARTGTSFRSDIAIDQIVLNGPYCPPFPTKYHSNNRNTRYYKQTPPQYSIQDLVAAGGTDPYFMALDLTNKKMYWALGTDGEIRKADLDGSNSESIYSDASKRIYGVAVDPCNNHLYWTEKEAGVPANDRIRRSDLDGNNIIDLVSGPTDLDNPTGITLDIEGGKIYWAQDGVVLTSQSIRRANLNGSDPEELVDNNYALQPMEVAIDKPAGKMYWTDKSYDAIFRANLDGSNPERVLSTNVYQPAGSSPGGIKLDLNLGKIYCAEFSPAAGNSNIGIWRANLDGSSIENIVRPASTDPYPPAQAVGLALDLDGGMVYWTDKETDALVKRANMPEKPVYDNGYVTHAIPQCSLQYSWIKASAITDRTQLLGYQSSGSY